MRSYKHVLIEANVVKHFLAQMEDPDPETVAELQKEVMGIDKMFVVQMSLQQELMPVKSGGSHQDKEAGGMSTYSNNQNKLSAFLPRIGDGRQAFL